MIAGHDNDELRTIKALSQRHGRDREAFQTEQAALVRGEFNPPGLSWAWLPVTDRDEFVTD